MSIKKNLKETNNLFVLDAYAVLAVIEDERGSEIVFKLLSIDKNQFLISVVNLGEVYYIIAREHGIEQAEKVVEEIINSENIFLVDADWTLTRKAAELKAAGGLSYADCFALAVSIENNTPVITGDKEIKQAAEKNPSIRLVWLG